MVAQTISEPSSPSPKVMLPGVTSEKSSGSGSGGTAAEKSATIRHLDDETMIRIIKPSSGYSHGAQDLQAMSGSELSF